MNRKAIFLDRDGVINHDPGDYTKHISEFTILPGVAEALKKWQDQGFIIVVITNQGGIAKNIYTLEDFYEIDTYMHTYFKEQGVHITETFFCPHHDVVSKCLCRKPASGMIEKAIARFDIDPVRSVMIGDKYRDLEAAEKAGVKGVKLDVNGDLRQVVLP